MNIPRDWPLDLPESKCNSRRESFRGRQKGQSRWGSCIGRHGQRWDSRHRWVGQWWLNNGGRVDGHARPRIRPSDEWETTGEIRNQEHGQDARPRRRPKRVAKSTVETLGQPRVWPNSHPRETTKKTLAEQTRPPTTQPAELGDGHRTAGDGDNRQSTDDQRTGTTDGRRT